MNGRSPDRRHASGAFLAAVLLSVSACGGAKTPATPPTPEPTAAAKPPDVVTLDDAAQKRAGITVDTVGTVMRADAADAPGLVALNETRTSRIGSLVEGVVVELKSQVGDRVRARQLLASLHSHAVHDAWAGYRKAKADERRLVTELRFATEALGRAERLYADKAIALQDLQRAQANKASAEESLDMGRAELRRSEEELEHLGITNGEDPTGETGEQIPVTAPLSGIVLERLVTQGTAVTPGTPLFVVSDLSTVWVLAELDEAHLTGAQVGRAASVRVTAYPSEVFEGKVTYIGESVNPKTRRVTIRSEVPNADGRLKPEMYATVQVGESEPRPIIAIPAASVQSLDGQSTVFVSEAGGRFRARPVELGAERDGLVEVKRGLAEGDRVATSGAFILKSEMFKSADTGE
ncbi:MAG: efflux RND transporter periplasmic adaptor subunit [Vicinamibacterales bacterium]